VNLSASVIYVCKAMWLDVDDCTFGKDGLTITLRRSKTDQEGEGHKPVVGSSIAKEPITAMEMRFTLFDAFNEHMTTLEITRVEDVASPSPFMFKMGLQNSSPEARAILSDQKRSPSQSLELAKLLDADAAKNPSRFNSNSNDVRRLLTVVSFCVASTRPERNDLEVRSSGNCCRDFEIGSLKGGRNDLVQESSRIESRRSVRRIEWHGKRTARARGMGLDCPGQECTSVPRIKKLRALLWCPAVNEGERG
jgi:hypothetical protein